MSEAVGAIIVAAGSGTRMGGLDKLFSEVGGRPLLAHAIAPFEECELVGRIVLVLAAEKVLRGRELVEAQAFSKVRNVVAGGGRRQDSGGVGPHAPGGWEDPAGPDRGAAV